MSEALSPAAELYIWGYPLIAIQRTRLLLCSKNPSGRINHVDDLATPKDRAIVVPNNDTLYSSGWYDLRCGDLTITVPAMDHPARYWNVMVMDAYGHQAYAARRHHGVDGTTVTVTLSATPPANDGSDVITVGTPTAWVILRVLVESAADLEQARALQRAVVVKAPPAHPQVRTTRGGRATEIAQAGASVFAELQQHVLQDPPAPWHPQLSSAAQAILEHPTSVPTADLEAGIKQGERLILGSNRNGTARSNGWSTGRAATGFGGDIVKRAAAARFGLGGHQAIENRSYTAEADATGAPVSGAGPLALRFAADALPPCDGFWSLTVYGTDMYLIENEIDRWSISDRTADLLYDDDGSLTIYLCTERPAQENNWLPVPAERYLLGMRVYEGHEQVVQCEWFPPPLVPLAQLPKSPA